MEAWRYLQSADAGETPKTDGYRLGDNLGEDIVNDLDELTAILLRDSVAATAYNRLEKIWEFIHGSTAVSRLFEYVHEHDTRTFRGRWEVLDCTAEEIRKATSIFD